MRNPFIVALLLLISVSAPTAMAQGSKLDLYGGYDYVRYNVNPRISGLPPAELFNANGASGQVAYYPNSWLGLVGEVSGYALARRGFATTHQISYLFGPRINLRHARYVLFGQVLLGRVWAEDGITFGSVTVFGIAAGGGIDVRVSRHIAIRPAQAEYFLTRFFDGNTNRQNNFRFGAGIVLRLGGKQ